MALDRRPDYRNAWENSDSDAVSALIERIDAWDWLDHWGTVVYGGEEYFVSEPYHMNRDRVDELLRFCTDLNLAFNIQASGHHYPTKTMRIFVWPKDWPHGDHFLQEKEGYRMGLQPGHRCLANLGSIFLSQVPERAQKSAKAATATEVFASEMQLRDYLVKSLIKLENGMTLWPVERGQRAIEFRVDDRNHRVDILARDVNGIPTIIETKVGRGHERTVGQVLHYQECVRKILKVERVRVLIVAKEISAELISATTSLRDVSLVEYKEKGIFTKLSPSLGVPGTEKPSSST